MPQVITTFAEANAALRAFHGTTATAYTLDTMRSLLHYLGNPQDAVRVVHVAGTSGKTSTAYYTEALLRATGKSTGLFVSPHVDQVNERLQLNGQLLPEAEYCQVLNEFLALVAAGPVRPSYFELLAGLAYWEFARRKVDFAVIEVGLGGLLDATNTISRADKVCVITDIGLDHTEILGDTIEAIAAQKAGIIQPGNTVYMHEQPASVVDIVRAHARAAAAQLLIVPAGTTTMPPQLPLFQQRNLGLAVTAVDATLRSQNETLSKAAIDQAATTLIPARLERFVIGDKIIIIDGSHNQQKLQTMVGSLQELYPGKPIAALCAFVAGSDKRWQGGLTALVPACEHITFTSFHEMLSGPKSSVDPAELVKYCENVGFHAAYVELDPVTAFEQLLKRPESILVVTGSFYLLNYIRPLLAVTQKPAG